MTTSKSEASGPLEPCNPPLVTGIHRDPTHRPETAALRTASEVPSPVEPSLSEPHLTGGPGTVAHL